MNHPLHILVAASEATPLARTSYMGDVVSALPKALLELGIHASLIIPRYSLIPDRYKQDRIATRVSIPIGDRYKHADLYRTFLDQLPVYLVDQPDYFNRESLYKTDSGDYPDNAERFIFFARSVIEMLPNLPDKPSIIHCNDWQTGLVPLYLKLFRENHPAFEHVKSLFTVHNLAYQGLFWRFDMHLTGLPWEFFTSEGIEFYGDLNLLKAGLLYSDAINTVSPRYCREIQTTEFGCGLEGVLQTMQKKLYGIINGADYTRWSPIRNPIIPAEYSPDNLTGKAVCKRAIIAESSLDAAEDGPILAMITPLYSRKGLDLLEFSLSEMIQKGIRVILQGIGDRNYVHIFTNLAETNPGHFAFIHNLDQDISQRMIAGADFLLKPSRFEPCGLNQIYALRFGTIPIVHRTGGLDDTVCDCEPDHPDLRTGFKFDNYTPESLLTTLDRALAAYAQPETWRAIMRDAMAQDFSWRRSATGYLELYQKLQQQDATE
ncbi:glycogen synthase GlgA [bacterium]|nr:glycogen synthase GlgA [candidate division CSSED10-310 bacterium]